MNKLLSFICFCITSLGVSFGSSISTPVTRTISDLKGSLMVYKMDHQGNMPKDWNEFISSGALSGEILDSARKYLDVENRYAIINTANVFEDIGGLARIVIMAKQPGGEGDQTLEQEVGKFEFATGRWLILETAKGDMYIRRYTEQQLESKFKRAGLSLKDYTFDAPPAPKIENKQKFSGRDVDVPQQKEENSLPPSSLKDEIGKKAESIKSESNASQMPTWRFMVFLGGLFAAIFAVWWTFRNKAEQ